MYQNRRDARLKARNKKTYSLADKLFENLPEVQELKRRADDEVITLTRTRNAELLKKGIDPSSKNLTDSLSLEIDILSVKYASMQAELRRKRIGVIVDEADKQTLVELLRTEFSDIAKTAVGLCDNRSSTLSPTDGLNLYFAVGSLLRQIPPMNEHYSLMSGCLEEIKVLFPEDISKGSLQHLNDNYGLFEKVMWVAREEKCVTKRATSTLLKLLKTHPTPVVYTLVLSIGSEDTSTEDKPDIIPEELTVPEVDIDPEVARMYLTDDIGLSPEVAETYETIPLVDLEGTYHQLAAVVGEEGANEMLCKNPDILTYQGKSQLCKYIKALTQIQQAGEDPSQFTTLNQAVERKRTIFSALYNKGGEKETTDTPLDLSLGQLVQQTGHNPVLMLALIGGRNAEMVPGRKYKRAAIKRNVERQLNGDKRFLSQLKPTLSGLVECGALVNCGNTYGWTADPNTITHEGVRDFLVASPMYNKRMLS